MILFLAVVKEKVSSKEGLLVGKSIMPIFLLLAP
jgi:hypothetical protein